MYLSGITEDTDKGCQSLTTLTYWPFGNREVAILDQGIKIMSLVINTNTAASNAASILNSTNASLQKSLARLSSGVKIINPSDDAGGLAVSVKMEAAIKRNGAVQNNIGNAMSFLQTQDGALKTVGKILDRMSELKTLHQDPTKSTSDKANFQSEFSSLQNQLGNLKAESFNGVSLFASSATSLSVSITEDGAKSVGISRAVLGDSTGLVISGTDLTAAANSLGASGVTVANIRTAIENVATKRATNGAQSSQLQFAAETLSINKTNLEAAKSRIIDTDIAAESTSFARFQILAQAGSAMLAQANQLPQSALRLLG